MIKQRLRPILIFGTIILTACLVFALLVRSYEKGFATVGQTRYEKNLEKLDLSGRSIADLTELRTFSNLKQIDLRGTGLTCEEYDAVRGWFPEAEILWDIPFQGEYYPMDTQVLTVSSLSEEDLAAVKYFRSLKEIRSDMCYDYHLLDRLRTLRPDLQVGYEIYLGKQWNSHDAKALVLSGVRLAELNRLLPFFTELEKLELRPPLAPVEDILALREAFPQLEITWQLEVGGIAVDEFTQTLDLTGIPMTVEKMDAVIPYLRNLTYVDMTDCGISNEEMDALNRRYEDIQIVWTVDIGRYVRLRTDATWFMPRKLNAWVVTKDVYNLRYCTELICIDIGHMDVADCEWAAFMPKLKYLLIADTKIKDISPLAGLQELVYLEMFLTGITDYSPLLECPALEDLNMYYTNGDPNVVCQMTWLKNLWWRSGYLTEADRNMLQEALSNTRIEFWSFSSTGRGWRQLPNYYKQRDILGMDYMNG